MEHLENLVKVWPVIVGVLAVVAAWFDFKGEIKALKVQFENMRREFKEDIARLERKQDKYNHLQERMAVNENSLKVAHNRRTLKDFCILKPCKTDIRKYLRQWVLFCWTRTLTSLNLFPAQAK